MISLSKLTLRMIACVLIAVSASACVPSSRSNVPLYYQPSLYSAPQPTGGVYSMEYYSLYRR